jgi:oligoribonuclease NrnB/cAMP/cGMP phosphodiesterase (DHH superfamily)
MDPRKNEERLVNAFETRCWRRMLKRKWADRITKDEVFQRAKEERLLSKILKNRSKSCIGHTIRHKEFVVNILEGVISGGEKKAMGRPQQQHLKQVVRSTGADSYTAMKRMACNNSRWKAANQSKD